MKQCTYFGAAAIALAAATSASAQSGYVGFSHQNADIGASFDVESTAISGAVLLGDHFQVSGRYASVDGGGNIDDWAVDGFAFNRSDNHAFGGFAGFETSEAAGASFDAWEVGGFGQIYTSRTNWTAQLGYSDTEGDVKLLHLDGEARHFLGDNFSIQANLGFGHVDFGPEENYWSGGLGAEIQLDGAPVSFHGGWRRVDFEDGGEGIDTLGGGVRWNFGGGTLMGRSRSGAGFQNTTPSGIELELGGGLVPR